MRHEHTRTDRPARFTPVLHPSRLRCSSAHASTAAGHPASVRRPALPSGTPAPHLPRLVALPPCLHVCLAAGRAALHSPALGTLLRTVRASVVPASHRWRAAHAPNEMTRRLLAPPQPNAKTQPCRESARPGDALISELADTPLRFVSPVRTVGEAIVRAQESRTQESLVDSFPALTRASRHSLAPGPHARELSSRLAGARRRGAPRRRSWRSFDRSGLPPSASRSGRRSLTQEQPSLDIGPCGTHRSGNSGQRYAPPPPVARVSASSRHADVWLAGARKLGNHSTDVPCLPVVAFAEQPTRQLTPHLPNALPVPGISPAQ